MNCCSNSAGRAARPRAATRLAACLLLLCLGSAVSLRADYLDDYEKALDAIEKLEWTEAQRLLLRAIQEQPEPSQFKMLQRFNTTPYLPYYYLGIVLEAQGDCEGALLQWQISRSKGKVRGERESVLTRMERACRDKLLETQARSDEPPPPSEDPSPLTAAASIRDGAGANDLPPVPTSGTPRDASTTGTSTGPTPPTAGDTPASARPNRDLDEEAATDTEISPQTRQRLTRLRARVERLIPEVQATLENSAEVQLPPEAAARRSELERELERLQRLSRQRPLRPLQTEQATDKVSALHAGYRAALSFLARPKPTTTGAPTAPTALILAADAYLRADYQRVLDDLEPWLSASDLAPKAVTTAQLLRAAAAYSLYLESGGEDSAALAQARAARAALPALRADAAGNRLALFSPPVRAFLTAETQP